MNTALGQRQGFSRYHAEHCNAGAGKTAYGLDVVQLGSTAGLKDAGKEGSFGGVGDTLNNENVAT